MEYFSLSPFYELNSINERCLRQKCDFNEKKREFKGIEFNIEHSIDKEIFIISKNIRKNQQEKILISYYYIFNGSIYQSPNLLSVITSNLESIANNINNIILEKNKDF